MSDENNTEQKASTLLQVKQLIEEAKAGYEHEYARAYAESPATAVKIFGFRPAKITENHMKQCTINDPKVKEARLLLLQAKALLVELERDEDSSILSLSATAKARNALLEIYLSEFEGSALEVFDRLSGEVDVVGENIATLNKDIDDRAGNWDKSFWEEVWENATTYKSSLTQYGEQLRLLARAIPSGEKDAIAEVRGVMDYADELRSDSESYIQLARQQVRG